MSGQRPSGNDGQEITSDTRASDALRHPAHPQQAYQSTHAAYQQQQTQYTQSDPSDLMRMSSLHAALPNVPLQNYAPGQRYSTNPYGVPPQAHPATYHGYPQSPTQQTGLQYAAYMDQAGHPMQYSPMQQQFPGASMYGGPPQSQPYGIYPPGFGPPSPIQQRGLQGQSHGYPGQEYTQHVLPSAQGSAQGSGRLGYPSGPKLPSASPTLPAAPRGPPRKPKQSGFALWVGNLPPGTRVDDLKDHFARDATKEIESVFLISKSNCAFVNYRTEEACAAAMNRFHDSRFQGVRLVTRLRKTPGSASSPVSGVGGTVPNGPSAQQQGSTQSQTAVEAIAQNRESSQKATEASQPADASVNDKYFVVKSLTVEDLELSVRNGIWATQGHNEDALNKAYEMVEDVYLIFSANKSGEYFGYARMVSPINDETAKDLEWKQHEGGARTAELHADPDLPRSIPTEATEWAPKGRIIDDSARGTIFWEAESDDAEEEPREVLVDGEIGSVGALKAQQDSDTEDGASSDDGDDEDSGAAELDVPSKLASKIQAGATGPTASESAESSHQPFGRPFRIQWLSNNRLPFYRTRGLRNAWNANREVKIARDGTELETGVGRRLISMFHLRPAPPAQMQQAQQYMGQTPAHMSYGMPPYGGRY